MITPPCGPEPCSWSSAGWLPFGASFLPSHPVAQISPRPNTTAVNVLRVIANLRGEESLTNTRSRRDRGGTHRRNVRQWIVARSGRRQTLGVLAAEPPE